MRKIVIMAGGVIVLLALVVAWGWVPDRVSDANCQLRHNAAWIDVKWTSKRMSEAAIRGLATDAQARRLDSLFPYVTFIKQDGSFSPSYDYARSFVSQFRAFNSNTLLLAWIGLPLENERPIGTKGWVDLSDPATRQKIVTFATQMRDAGFDGVHLDAETVPNNDPHYLVLLDEMRNALGRSRISIAGSHWIPDAANAIPWIQDFRWTGGYYDQVARRVDQIAVMTYDSFAPAGVLYRLWVREQARGISNSVGPSNTEVLIGISVSPEDTASHHPQVENLANGLAGLCASQPDESRVIQGVALYADWDFSPSDRQIWNDWQKKP